MPEASIGFFPDVGANYFLSRLPGFFGRLLQCVTIYSCLCFVLFCIDIN